jgi:hypothetical protein
LEVEAEIEWNPSIRAQATRFEYCLTAALSITTAKPTSTKNGTAISAGPAPFTRIAREIVTK